MFVYLVDFAFIIGLFTACFDSEWIGFILCLSWGIKALQIGAIINYLTMNNVWV